MKVAIWNRKNVPVDICFARGAFFSDVLEVTVDNVLLKLVFRDPATVVLEAVNEFFSPTMVDPQMEVAGVSISFFQISYPRILPLS